MDDEKQLSNDEGADIIEQNPNQALAAKLKALREKENYSEDELSHITKISIEAIWSLEKGDFERLPSKVFVRGFIKNICLALDEDPKEYLELFGQCEKSLSDKAKQFVDYSSPLNKQKSKNRFKSRLKMPILTAISLSLVVILISGAGFLGFSYFKSTTENELAKKPGKPPLPQTTQSESVPPSVKKQLATEPVPVVKQQAGPQALKVQMPETKVSDSKQNQRQALNIVSTKDVKIRINIDNSGFTQKSLSPGDYEFEFTKNAEMLIYDASAVTVQFNGRPLGPLGGKGRLRKISFRHVGPSKNF